MTWSILARDPQTGELGAAVATRFFAVGALCLHVEGGVGALATQALINPMYGIDGMARLRQGQTPDEVAAALLAADEGRESRQLHIIDAQGRVASHTGRDCIGWCGMVRGIDVSVAGNMLAGEAVIEATLAAFAASTGGMAERLLSALEAGEAQGGDKRGRQSAALRICGADPYPDLDIRADDHPDPLAELRRLLAVSRERFTTFRRFLPGRANPSGVFDRAIIDAAVASAEAKSAREKAVAAAMDRVRAIEHEQGVTRASLDAIKAEMLALAAQEKLFPSAEFPPLPAGEKGSKRYLLQEDPGGRFAIYMLALNPGNSTKPHDHTTWAVVTAVEGQEVNRVYRRTDNGSVPDQCVLELVREVTVEPGTGIALMPEDIHSIHTTGDSSTRHLHVYGLALEKLDRRLAYDNETGVVKPYNTSFMQPTANR